jgi:adenosylcobyric acid synthase
VWARSPADLAHADWIILPGSKHTSSDLAWLRRQKLDAAIAAHAARGGRVLGICGGLQILGEALIDPYGIDGNAPGLGLLPLVTQFEETKTVRHTTAQFAPLCGAWAALSHVRVNGYEIHHGITAVRGDLFTGSTKPVAVLPPDLAWQNAQGNVLGVYVHGLFEDAAVLHALFGVHAPTLESVFDAMAAFIELHFVPGCLDQLIA